MAPRRPSPAELRGARPVFLLVVEWLGRVYRFASEPLQVTTSEGLQYRFSGSLDLRSYSDTLPRSGSSQTGGTASLGVEFVGLNVTQEYLRGRILEGALCELSMIFVRAGVAVTLWEDRIVQIAGSASRPQIGFPDRPAGFAAFTVTARPYDDSTPVLSPGARIVPGTQAAAGSEYYGAAYPLVFGSPGNANTPGSPGYLIKSVAGDRRILIAAGRVDASRVTVSDEDGNEYQNVTVEHDIDGSGTLYAYINVSGAPSPFKKAEGRHHIHWTYLGLPQYGLQNPFGPGGLSKSTDVLRYLLGLTPRGVDNPAWQAAAGVLDRYTLGGYVNDPAITVWGFVSGELLPLLPVQVRNGPDGLYPVSLLPVQPVSHLPQLTISDSSGLVQIAPIQITKNLREIVNQTALAYEFNDRERRLTLQLVESPSEAVQDRARVSEAQRSREIYGARTGPTVEAGYIDSEAGAQQVLRWLLLDRGFLHMSAQVRAAPRWGWLQVGDHVSLTASDLGMTGKRAIVTSKAWDGTAWRFVLSWSLAPLEELL